MRSPYICCPVSQRFIYCIFQCLRTNSYFYNPRAQKPHSENIQCLSFHVLSAHVNITFKADKRSARGSCNSMLSGARFSDDSFFADSFCKKRLPQRIVYLVSACVSQVFPFKIYLCSSEMFRKSLCKVQRSWSSYICFLEVCKLFLKIFIFPVSTICFFKFNERRHQCLGNKSSAILSEITFLHLFILL